MRPSACELSDQGRNSLHSSSANTVNCVVRLKMVAMSSMQKLTLLVTSIDELKSDMSNSASHKHEYKNNFVNKSYDSIHLSLDWAKVQLIVPKLDVSQEQSILLRSVRIYRHSGELETRILGSYI